MYASQKRSWNLSWVSIQKDWSARCPSYIASFFYTTICALATRPRDKLKPSLEPKTPSHPGTQPPPPCLVPRYPSCLRRLLRADSWNRNRMSERAEPLRLGSKAPNFQAETTQGNIDFHGACLCPSRAKRSC